MGDNNPENELCPNRSVRISFVEGRLSNVLAVEVAEHFAQCHRCASEIEAMDCIKGLDRGPLALHQANNLRDDASALCEVVLELTGNQSSSHTSKIKPILDAKYNPEIPQAIGRYSIQELSGYGSFGVVYRARHPHLEKDVAIKVSHGDLHSDSTGSRFLEEANTAARLDHQNVVLVLDADKLKDGRCFIVFEYIEGSELSTFCKNNKLGVGEVVSIFCDILRGVSHAHKAGVTHRDLKPANIIVTGERIPKIVDFGLALSISKQPTPEFAGTKRYMAPEQLRGETAKIDARTDIYALGVILFEVLTGVSLSSSSNSVVEQIDQLPSNKRFPQSIRRICLKCCAEDQHDRYGLSLMHI